MELMRAREAAMARFRPTLRDHQLTEQQWRVLRALADTDGIDASELAKQSLLLSPSLTRILQHLESAELITRTNDANDNRRAVVKISRKGRKLFNKVAPLTEVLYSEIEQEFGTDRLNELYALLKGFYTTLNAAD
jgi:homoprotocatechuate degradation regulator HpaR